MRVELELQPQSGYASLLHDHRGCASEIGPRNDHCEVLPVMEVLQRVFDLQMARLLFFSDVGEVGDEICQSVKSGLPAC